ncbi:MAG: hypothetical protein WKF75_00405 [Singulisphaera sp.]
MEIKLSETSPKYTSLDQASRYCGLSVSTLERRIKSRQLDVFQVGRRKLVELRAVDRMVQSGRVAVA